MSGPKCYRYQVREDPAIVAARQEAAAFAVARARAEGAIARLKRLEDEADDLRERHGRAITPVAVPAVPAASTSADLNREAKRLENRAAEAEERLRAELGDARKASFIAQLAAGARAPSAGTGLERLLAAVAARASPAADERKNGADRSMRLAEECARVFERLRGDVPARARDQVERTLEVALAGAAQERAPLLVDRLRAAVQAANDEAEVRDRRAQQIDALIAGLGGIEDDEAKRLRDLLLAEREEGKPIGILAAQIERARHAAQTREEEARKRVTRQRVASALEESLQELGYEIQPGFDTALAADGSAFARRDGWSDHAVRVLLDPATDELRLHVVRDDKPRLIGSDDLRRETELCVDRPVLEQALNARGIEVDPQELIEPGVIPVAVVPLRRRFPARMQAAKTLSREGAL